MRHTVWLPYNLTPPPPSYFSLPLSCRLSVSGFSTLLVFPTFSEVRLSASLFLLSLRLIRLSLVWYLTGFLRVAWKWKYHFYVLRERRRRRSEDRQKERNWCLEGVSQHCSATVCQEYLQSGTSSKAKLILKNRFVCSTHSGKHVYNYTCLWLRKHIRGLKGLFVLGFYE